MSINKIIVYFYHKEVGELLLKELVKQFSDGQIIDIDVFLIYGDTEYNQRDDIIDKFKDNIKSTILLVSLMTCSLGYSLVTNFCNTIIFCELEYRPHLLLQAEGRLLRLNNQFSNMIHIYYLFVDGHDTDVLANIIAKKHDMITNVLQLYNRNCVKNK